MGLLTPVAIRLGALPWLPRFLPQIVWLDTRLQRLTRGRLSLAGLAGLPNLLLTVPGRRSGAPRSIPLLCLPDDGRYLVAGSYFGGPKEPMWVGNLEASGAGTLRFKGRSIAFTARRLTGDERAAAWERMNRTWPNYRRYEQRANREIKVFELAPTP